MARPIAIGEDDFTALIQDGCFYIDKTMLIKEWWEKRDKVTLITRPRRFGKTLNMSMLERFWDNQYAGQGEIFENLAIWQEKEYRELQGSYPVLFLSFAGVKADNYPDAKEQIFQVLEDLYTRHHEIKESGILEKNEIEYFERVGKNMSDSEAAVALQRLSNYLYRCYHQKVIVLLDEYDTPLQEAYVHGYWKELVSLTRNLFNNTFKTNSYLKRALMTGITRVSKESMFSDLNNLNVVTMASGEYASYFGFSENEVFIAMDEFGLTNKQEVKQWYDGFTIGDLKDIYNPWSIICFLDKQKLGSYWANTSSNGLVCSLIQRGNRNIKMEFEKLLQGHSIHSVIDDEMVFDQLDGGGRSAVWSLLFASGYLKVLDIQGDIYELKLTNYEVRRMFESMVNSWFYVDENYNDFIKSLLNADVESMNEYMNRFALNTISYFDVGDRPSEQMEPERFYHGFVLGLLVDLRDKYEVISNRESGFGRYDVMLRPLNEADDAIIMEFKVYNPKKEQDMEETVQAALQQIDEKRYEQTLMNQGIEPQRIRKYGFAFQGKEVLIG